MTHWQNRLEIKDEWRKAKRGEMTVQELARAVALKLQELYPSPPEKALVGIIDEFAAMSQEESLDSDIFDSAMWSLYEWGDRGHRLWIATF